MFELLDNENNVILVYDIKVTPYGVTTFLIFDDSRGWIWINSSGCTPHKYNITAPVELLKTSLCPQIENTDFRDAYIPK